MKKIFTAAIFFILLLTGCGKKSDKEVKVYNFKEYINPQILKNFKKEIDHDGNIAQVEQRMEQ